MKIFFNLSNLPEIIGQYKNFPKCPQFFLEYQNFPWVPKTNWAEMNLFFIFFVSSWSFKLPEIYQASWKIFCESFQASGFFKFLNFWAEMFFFFNVYNLPEIIKQKFLNYRYFLKHPGKHFSGNVQNDQSFWAPWKKIHTYVSLSWRNFLHSFQKPLNITNSM